MSLYSKICQYFNEVINYTDFVLAVDCAGLFVFSSKVDDGEIVEKVDDLLNALALTRDQAVICVLDDLSDNVFNSFDSVERAGDKEYVHHVPRKYLEDFIRKYSSRDNVLTDEDVVSIIECFHDVEGRIKDVELRESLKEYGLTDGCIDKLLKQYVITKSAIYDAGVKYEDAEAVYQLLTSKDGGHCTGDVGEEEWENGVQAVIVKDYVNLMCALSMIASIAFFVVTLIGYPIIAFVCYLCCYSVMKGIFKTYDYFIVRASFLILLLCIALDVYKLLPLAAGLVKYVVESLDSGVGLSVLNPLRWMECLLEQIE